MIVLWLLGAYLLGSISFSYLIVRWRRGVDIRSTGSGNAGATNAMRSAGSGVGALVLLADLLKGALPVWAFHATGGTTETSAWVGIAAVLGHVFPIFFGFRGGKGVATAAGVYLAINPIALGLTCGLFGAVLAATRMVSASSLAAAAGFAPLWWGSGRLGWTEPPTAESLWTVLGLTALVFWTHRGNIRRLAAGAERRLGGDR